MGRVLHDRHHHHHRRVRPRVPAVAGRRGADGGAARGRHLGLSVPGVGGRPVEHGRRAAALSGACTEGPHDRTDERSRHRLRLRAHGPRRGRGPAPGRPAGRGGRGPGRADRGAGRGGPPGGDRGRHWRGDAARRQRRACPRARVLSRRRRPQPLHGADRAVAEPRPRHRGPGRRRGRRAADSAGRRRPGGESLSARGGASRPSASSNQPALRALLRARRRRPATLPGRPAARPPCPRPRPTAPR